MGVIFSHEWRTYFTTAMGYVFIGIYTLLAGIVCVSINISQEASASVNLLFSGMQLPSLLICPLLTMRLFAEERRMKTDQLILTSPIPTWKIVAGKAFASFAMMFLAMVLVLAYPLLLSFFAQMELVQVLTTFLGYLLLNTAMLSVGVLVSSLCENQVTSAVITLAINLFMYLAEYYVLPQLNGNYSKTMVAILNYLPSASRLSDFANGVISLSDMAFFLTFIGIMLYFTFVSVSHRQAAKE